VKLFDLIFFRLTCK